MRYRYVLILMALMLTISLSAQEPFEGYTLYNSNGSSTAQLLDMNGDTVHSWSSSSNGGYSCYLLDDGSVLRPMEANNTSMSGAASSGRFLRQDWEGNTLWQFDYHGNDYLPHHDIEPLPNGNVLIVTWKIKSGTEAVQAGRSSYTTMWPDYIVEIEPDGTNGGTVVWEWHFWDHLIQDHDSTKDNYGVVEDHPELLDVNQGSIQGGPGGGGDWLHVNGIDYNPVLDQIVISSHNLDEIYVIDHSTTTEEAASHSGGNSGMGGDILYRWGFPSNYGATGSYNFNVVHCAYWVPEDCPGAGNLMAFNNGSGTNQSKVVEIEPPYENTYNYSWTSGTSFAPDAPVWQYSNGTSFYSNHLGSVQRLPNGNTLISESTSGYMFEVDVNGTIVWDKDISSQIARCLRYGTDYSGLAQLFPNGVVNGTILDNLSSEPIENAEITIGSNTDTTNPSGFYEVTLAAGTYQLICEHPDYADYTHPDDIVLEENDAITIDFTMFPATEIGFVSGSITDIFSSAPVANATITLGEHQTQSDANGMFSLNIEVGTYQLMVEHPDYFTYNHPDDIVVEALQTTEIDISLTPLAGANDDPLVSSTHLLGNYPNPFNPSTTIHFQLNTETIEDAQLTIYNLKGQLIHQFPIFNDQSTITWNGTDNQGRSVPSGIFFYRLQSGEYSETRKMILLK
jgi:Arylsulfotransferase (ASST)/Carboxypeptidase regulatory-like domain/Secretion system C-terminal sorting domain